MYEDEKMVWTLVRNEVEQRGYVIEVGRHLETTLLATSFLKTGLPTLEAVRGAVDLVLEEPKDPPQH